jgi:phenylalanyl-tRNA synthetase beta chain
MPQSTLSLRRVVDRLPSPVDGAELDGLLFRSKAELADLTGDALRIEVTADRLDLLSEGGLGLYLAGAAGAARGPPALASPALPPSLVLRRDPSVAPHRPILAGLVVEAPPGAALEDGLLAEAVRFQELLHATVGRDRRLASLGMYPLERLTPPVAYALEPVGRVRFTPLDGDAEVAADQFLATHPLAARYGPYGVDPAGCLTLRDSRGAVLSLPPILNARTVGEVRPGDRRLLLESTGTLAGRVQDALALLSLVFLARGWTVAPVPVEGPEGRDDGRSLIDPRAVRLRPATLASIAGEPIAGTDVEAALGRARLGIRTAGPDGWTVEVPPWRPDLLAEVDLVEEVLFARGLRVEGGILPPSRTRGRRRPENRFRARLGALLLGLGYVPLVSTVLVPGDAVRRLGLASSVEVANPVSEQFSHLRDRLLVSLVGALGRNVRHGYPQRLSEIGPVLVREATAESGAATRYHAAVVIAGERAGFADAAALVEYLLGALGTPGVREPVELPATIAGRAARLRLAGVPIAEIGELRPEILADLSIPVPVAFAEVDLSRLWPLLAGPTAPGPAPDGSGAAASAAGTAPDRGHRADGPQRP